MNLLDFFCEVSQNNVFDGGKLSRGWYQTQPVYWLNYIQFHPTESGKYLWDIEIHCTEDDQVLACSLVDPCYQRAFAWISPDHKDHYFTKVSQAGFDPTSIPKSFALTRVESLEDMVHACVSAITLIHGRADETVQRAVSFLSTNISNCRNTLLSQSTTSAVQQLVSQLVNLNSVDND